MAKDENKPKVGEAAPKKRRKRWPIVLGVVAVVLVACGIGFGIWHEQPTFCNAICHSPMDKYVESYSGGKGMDRVHAEAGVVCLDCHEAKLGEQIHEAITWIKGDFRKNLDMLKYDSAGCLECHDKDAVKAATAELVAQGTITRDPHADIHQVLACTDCHRSHRAQVDYCTTCHDNGGQVMIAWPAAREYTVDTTPDW